MKSIIPRYGYTPSIAKGHDKAIKRALRFNISAIQFWMGSTKQYASKLYPPERYLPARKMIKEHNIFAISHSPYLINMARPLQESKVGLGALKRIIVDLENITNFGGVGTVVHMGSNVKGLGSMTQAYQRFVDNLQWIIDRKPHGSFIILENMAGGGTQMCCRMKEWADFWNNWVPADMKPHLRWCVDTAHLYAAGEYDLSLRTEVLRFYRDFCKNIGKEYLLCFHFNGSKSKLGSCHDCHADIGVGEIAEKGLRQVARIAGANNIPIILEVPADSLSLYEQFKTINRWFGKDLEYKELSV